MFGVRLLMEHPEVASLSCDDCGKYQVSRDWTIGTRANATGTARIPLPRVKGNPTPCGVCPKIPDDAPKSRAYAQELTWRNRLAFEHYLECRAVGEFPRDWLVRRNARIIRDVMDGCERLAGLQTLLSLSAARKG